MADYSIWSFLLGFIQKTQYLLVILAIIFGSLIFYSNREEVENLEEENKNTSNKKAYFYLFLIIIFWFFLRYYHLWYILPFSDEYTHLANVKKLYDWITIEDDRWMFLNYTIKYLYDFFWYNINNFFDTYKQWLFLARIPWVITWTVTIFVFYLIWKELIWKKLGLLLAFLLAISPMNLEMSKFIREYIYYFFLLSVYILLALKINLHKINSKNNIILWIYTSLLLIFSFFIEPLSTLKVIIFFLFSTIVAIAFSNIKTIKKIFKNNKKIIFISIVILSIIFIIFYEKFWVFLWLNTKYTWLDYFITNKRNYASGLNNIWYLSLIFILIWSLWYFFKKKISNYKLNLIIILFVIFIIFYVFLFDRYIQIRYAYYVFIPFIILLWLWIYFILEYVLKNKKIWFSLLLLATLSIHTTLYSLNWYEYWKWNRITDHYIENYLSTAKFIKKNKENINVLVTTYISINYLAWINIDKIIHYKYNKKNRFYILWNVIKKEKNWYIIIDNRRNWFWTKWLPKKDFKMWKKEVQLISKINWIQIYKW